MNQLESPRLILRNGSKERPTTAELQQGYRRYVIEHEDPSVSYDQYADENIFGFLNAQRGSIFGYYMLYPKNLDTWIGHCSLYALLCEPPIVAALNRAADGNPLYSALEVEIGWAISNLYRNQGYATEGANALLAYGFEELKLERIIALTERDNLASIRVMEKIGMDLVDHPTTDGIIGVATRNR